MRFMAAGAGYTIDPDTLLPVADDPAAMRRAAEDLLAAEGAEAPGAGARGARISAAAWMFATAGDPQRADQAMSATPVDEAGWTLRQRAVVGLRRAQVHQILGRAEAAVTLARAAVALLDPEVRPSDTSTAQPSGGALAPGEPTRREPADPLVATALHHLGKALIDVGELDEATRVLHRALALREAAGDADLVASTRLALALLGRRRAR